MPFSCFVQLGDADLTLKVLPGAVSEAEAKEQLFAVCEHMRQFPGGTQSMRGWIEPD